MAKERQPDQFRYRRGYWGRLILQIRQSEYHYRYPSGWRFTKWRDAKVEDLSMVTNVIHAMEVK